MEEIWSRARPKANRKAERDNESLLSALSRLGHGVYRASEPRLGRVLIKQPRRFARVRCRLQCRLSKRDQPSRRLTRCGPMTSLGGSAALLGARCSPVDSSIRLHPWLKLFREPQLKLISMKAEERLVRVIVSADVTEDRIEPEDQPIALVYAEY